MCYRPCRIIKNMFLKVLEFVLGLRRQKRFIFILVDRKAFCVKLRTVMWLNSAAYFKKK